MKYYVLSQRLGAIGILFSFWLAIFPVIGSGQVVQLPSYRAFGYTGSALIPDGGGVDLGGIGYSASSTSSRGFGPYASRVTSRSIGNTSISASAQIIDLQALDEAILSSASPRSVASRSAWPSDADGNAGVASSGLAANSSGSRSPDGLERVLKAIESQDNRRQPIRSGEWQRISAGNGRAYGSDEEPSSVESNVRYYVTLGREAENANSSLAARVYYRMAAEAMTPELRQRYEQIIAERQAAEQLREAAENDSDSGGRKSF